MANKGSWEGDFKKFRKKKIAKLGPKFTFLVITQSFFNILIK